MHPTSTPARPGVLFFLFALVLIYGIFCMGVPIAQENLGDRERRDVFLLAVGVLGTVAGLKWGRLTGVNRAEDRIVVWAAIALPCYVLFQLLPLPAALVGALSPGRAELLRGLEPLSGHKAFASLSITPSLTFEHFLLIAAYCVVLLAAREFAIRAGKWIWLLAAPVVAAGAVEAAMALVQFLAGGDTQARGTYGVRNHLAGLLEMAVPLAAMFGVSSWRTYRRANDSLHLLFTAGAFAVSALLLAGAMCTLSRGGFASILFSGFVMVALSAGRDMTRKRRLAMAAGCCVALAVAFVYLTPETLIARLSEHTSEGRTAIWREGLGVVREFPVFGTGVGGFQSAFLKFKASEGTFLVDYAPNDYLQTLAELGMAGFPIALLLAGSVVVRSLRRTGEVSDAGWLGVACLGSFAAILLHSAVDFNLYVAANAAVLAWICGIAAGLRPSVPRIIRRRSKSRE